MWTTRVPIVRLVVICARSRRWTSSISQKLVSEAKKEADENVIPAPASIYQGLIGRWLQRR